MALGDRGGEGEGLLCIGGQGGGGGPGARLPDSGKLRYFFSKLVEEIDSGASIK